MSRDSVAIVSVCAVIATAMIVSGSLSPLWILLALWIVVL